MKRLLSLCCTMALMIGMTLSVSMNSQASTSVKVIDGSYLTHDKESIGYDTKITRGEDLLTGYSKCVEWGPGELYAGGTTIAAHTVNEVGLSVMIERAKEEDTEWSFYDSWNKFNQNSDRVSSSKGLKVEGDYYYRVRCTHSAASDMSSSFTDGVYIEKP